MSWLDTAAGYPCPRGVHNMSWTCMMQLSQQRACLATICMPQGCAQHELGVYDAAEPAACMPGHHLHAPGVCTARAGRVRCS